MRYPLASTSLGLFLALAGTASGQSVWVVDDDGGAGVDFTEIASAVSAAGEGDLVLVRDGTYSEFIIAGKSLSVVADAGHRPLVSEPQVGFGSGSPVVRIYDLAAGQEVYLRGLDLGGTYFQAFSRTPFMSIYNNQGEIWIEDVATLSGFFGGYTGLDVSSCVGVNIARCNFTGTVGDPTYGEGITATGSNLTIWDSVARGGPGTAILGGLTDGQTGLRLEGGSVFVSGSTLRGGAGASTTFYDSGSNGGDGLQVDGGALVRERDNSFLGGAGGTGVLQNGSPGQPTTIASGTLLPVVGNARSYEISSPVRAGVDSITETYTGQPGDIVYLLWSYTGQIPGFYLGIEHGSFVIDFTGLDGAFVGTIGPTGTLVETIPPLSLVGLDFYDLPTQASFLEPGGAGFYITGPSLLTILAATF